MRKCIRLYKNKEDMDIGAFFKEIIIFEYQLDMLLEWYKECLLSCDDVNGEKKKGKIK